MNPITTYDRSPEFLICIGGGSGGVASSRRAASYGKKAAPIESSPNLGGTCVNFNWASFKPQRDANIRRLNGIYEKNLEKEKVDYYGGTARLVSPTEVQITPSDGGEPYVIAGDYITVATGGRPGMRGAREKLQWASMRVTTLQEDTAYSLFDIFGVHLPVIYGETKQNEIDRFLQEIVAQLGDITALDWVGKSSDFNSCLLADITSYKPPPCMQPSLSEDQMQMSVSSLRNATIVELACTLYTQLDNLSASRFANQDKLIQFSPARPTSQTFLLIQRGQFVRARDESLSRYRDDEPIDTESHSRELRLIVRLGQPFGGAEWGGEYKRIASDHNIIAQVKDMASNGDISIIRDALENRSLLPDESEVIPTI
ncbi:hypothetical protein DFH29DRAFT_1077702 [Suillus ampliporus]|nr:hypothetical protein DFH29DRAFT_1077702 [Suillus ampliporus]